MLESMTHDEVVAYAKTVASQTKDVHAMELHEIVQTAVAQHEESIAQFKARNDEFPIPTPGHQENVRLWTQHREQCEKRTKEAIIQALMRNTHTCVEASLRKDLRELNKSKLLSRARSHGILVPEAIEDDRDHSDSGIRAAISTVGVQRANDLRMQQTEEAQIIERIINAAIAT